MYRLVCVLAIALTGCYAKTPPRRPHIELPELADGQALVLEDGVFEYRNKYGRLVEVDATEVSYNGERVSRGQITAMSTPSWETKTRQYDARRRSCQRYQVPRAVASAMMLGSILFFYYGSGVIEDQRTRLFASLGGWGGGLLVYSTGYLLGGKVCNDAAEMYDRYFTNPEEKQFVLDGEIKRVKQMVHAYNQRAAAATASAPAADD